MNFRILTSKRTALEYFTCRLPFKDAKVKTLPSNKFVPGSLFEIHGFREFQSQVEKTEPGLVLCILGQLIDLIVFDILSKRKISSPIRTFELPSWFWHLLLMRSTWGVYYQGYRETSL